MSLFSDVGPLEIIAENKKEQKSAAKRRQRLLKAAQQPPMRKPGIPPARILEITKSSLHGMTFTLTL